jgi:3',5'-cyclic-AMP phosphodiesterase
MSKPVRFDVISDIQGDMADLDVALAAFAEFAVADQLLINGDVTDNGRVRQYKDLTKHLAATPHPPALFTIGNHDFYNKQSTKVSIDRFLSHTAMASLYSAHEVGAVPIIRLGTTDGSEKSGHYVIFGDEQLTWFAAELAQRPATVPVIVLSHHVLPNSVSGSFDDPATQAPKMYGRDYAEVDRVLEILTAHPNVLFLSGHSHWSLYRPDWFSRPSFAAANTGAIQRGFGPDGVGGEQPLDGPHNQGLRIVVEGATVTVHALDFVNRRVAHTAEFSVPDPAVTITDGVAWSDALG